VGQPAEGGDVNCLNTQPAQLVEETHEGFYTVGAKESKAVFVPRSALAFIYFSDNPAESPMLQGNKALAPQAKGRTTHARPTG